MSITTFSLPLANGVTNVPLNDGAVGQIELQFTGTAPTTGTLKVEGLTWAENDYYVIGGGTAVNLTALASGPIRLSDFGHFQALRLTLSSVTGATGVLTGASASFPVSAADLAFVGHRALNVQSYIESNTKNGTQFYMQFTLPAFSGAGTYNIVMTTGALPVLIKDRSMYSDGASISSQLFKAPTGVTGGTPITVQNYNDINPATTTVALLGGATVTTAGTSWGDPLHIYGAGGTGQRVGWNLLTHGDRVLQPNSSYLFRVVNATGAANVDYFISWYEGQPDLPRK